MEPEQEDGPKPIGDCLSQVLEDLKGRLQFAPEPAYRCPECQDTKFINYERDGHQYAKRCSCFWAPPANDQEAEARLVIAGLGRREARLAFEPWHDNFDGNRSSTFPLQAQRWAASIEPKKSVDPWLFIFAGERGRGKTKAMAMIALSLIRRSYRSSIRWFDIPESCEAIARDRALGRDASFEIEDKMRNVSIAFFDDFTAINSSGAKRDVMANVLDHRFRAEAATIVTLNMRGHGLESAIEDSRLLSRLLSGIMIPFNGKSDLRIRKAGN